MNSQNQYFNANVSLVSARGVTVFADYQLLAAMGQLLTYLKTAKPPEADLLETRPLGFIPYRLPPVSSLLTAPEPGSEPLNTVVPFASWSNPLASWSNPFAPSPDQPHVVTFGDRWSSNDPNNANALFLASGKFGQAAVSADAAPASK